MRLAQQRGIKVGLTPLQWMAVVIAISALGPGVIETHVHRS